MDDLDETARHAEQIADEQISPVIRAETLPARAGSVPLTGAKGSPQSSVN
jgi:hypothetical protein